MNGRSGIGVGLQIAMGKGDGEAERRVEIEVSMGICRYGPNCYVVSSRVCSTRYAVAQSRTYLFTYIVLLQEALP